MRLPIAIISISLAAQTAAGDIPLALPIDCDIGDTCHIQQTVDHDPTQQASDFTCGFLTYNGHKGTDFALPSLQAQANGVDVLAAAPGTVRAVRDGMVDILQTEPNAPDVSGRECGNGIVINHGDGWETQYCHMANGSVAVKSGDTVAMGKVLGRVGLSGETEFPHLHMSLRHNGDVIDPFDPDGTISCDAPSEDTLWNETVNAPSGGMIASGFSPAVPNYDDIKAGTAAATTLSPTDALVIWGYLFGGRADDEIKLKIEGPSGEVISETVVLERNQSQLFRAVGRRAPSRGWPTGDYSGSVQLVRDNAVLDTSTAGVTIR